MRTLPETIHAKCAGTTALASNGALNRVKCKHCIKREKIQDAGPSSDEIPGNRDEDTSSDSSQEEDNEDPDYTDLKDARPSSRKRSTRAGKRPSISGKEQRVKNNAKDPTAHDVQRLTRALTPVRADKRPETPAIRNELRRDAQRKPSQTTLYDHELANEC